jgi:saccharopine dehydrogenase-like NADP-dependent oxidoreductase
LENLTGGYRRKYGRGNSSMLIWEVETNFLQELNGSGTMVWQGASVQLEQSDMRLVFSPDKIPREELWWATIDEMQYLIQIPHATVLAETKWGVVFPRHGKAESGKV